jgi:pimeloyl-ACP methyl ester carboxylesterase
MAGRRRRLAVPAACLTAYTRRLSLSGKGTPIAMLHGFADSADMWCALMAEFEAAGRALFAADTPDFGRW